MTYGSSVRLLVRESASGSMNRPLITGRYITAIAASTALLLTAAGPGGAARGDDRGIVDVSAILGRSGDATVGTGMVIDGSGEVLTNNHVIRGGTSIQVSDPASGRVYLATVVGYDTVADVAVLKLEHASNLMAVSLGNSSDAKVGEAIAAIGNAGGAGGTPSRANGKVLALDQSITAIGDSGGPERLTGLIEISARTQPGDSGGALVDGAGRVIGMDTAGTARFAVRQDGDDGFAIPIDRVRSIASRIERGRPSTTIHIGPTSLLGVDTVSPGYDPNFHDVGARVTVVLPGTPAQRLGLARGDIIYAVDGQSVSSPTALTNLVIRRPPGTSIELRWIDQAAKTHHANVRLASGPPQ
jgi:S1-C subfamily serine protease